MDKNEIAKREVIERLVATGGLSRNDAQMVADLAEKAADDAKLAILSAAKLAPSEKLQIAVLALAFPMAIELMSQSREIVYSGMADVIVQRKE